MDDPIALYLAELRRLLSYECDAKTTRDILVEVESHLAESVDELIGRGLSLDDARKAALANFGEVRKSASWYIAEHGKPSVWRACRWPLALTSLTMMFWKYQNTLFPGDYFFHIGHTLVIDALIAATAFACFRSRRITLGVTALVCLGLYAVTFVNACMNCVPVRVPLRGDWVEYGIAKGDIPSTIKRSQAMLAIDEAALPTLEAGRRAFAATVEPSTGVGRFKDSRGYLSQLYFEMQDPRVHEDFQGDLKTNGIFPTYSQARNFWVAQPCRYCYVTGKPELFYLAEKYEEIFEQKALLAQLPAAGRAPLARKIRVFRSEAAFEPTVMFCVAAIADLSAALLRLLIRLVRKRRSQGPIAA